MSHVTQQDWRAFNKDMTKYTGYNYLNQDIPLFLFWLELPVNSNGHVKSGMTRSMSHVTQQDRQAFNKDMTKYTGYNYLNQDIPLFLFWLELPVNSNGHVRMLPPFYWT